VGASRGGAGQLAEEEEATLAVPMATVAPGSSGIGGIGRRRGTFSYDSRAGVVGDWEAAAGWRLSGTGRGSGGRAPSKAAPGGWSMRRRQAEQGGSTGGRASKEAAAALCAQETWR
jgi:hypothetical protein